MKKDRETIKAIAVSSDGKFALLGLASGTLEVFDPTTKKVTRTLGAEKGSVTGLAISPDGTLALCDSLSAFGLWHIPTGKTLLADPAKGGKGFSYPFSFSPDGKFAVCSRTQQLNSDDNKNRVPKFRHDLVLLAIPSGKVERKYPIAMMGSCVFTADGKGILGQTGILPQQGVIGLWKLADGKKVWSVEPDEPGTDPSAVAYSPDRKLVFSAHSYDGPEGPITIKIRDPATGKLIRCWKTSKDH